MTLFLLTVRTAFIVLLLMSVVGCQTAPAAPFRVRVLSYNIHHAEGVDQKLDLERIAQVVKSVNPDLVALQEVDHKTQRTKGVDQAAELGRLTGMHAFFGKAFDYQGGGYGAAVLSRWQFVKTEANVLPGSPGHEIRPAATVTIKPAGMDPFTFVSLHLDHRADTERLVQSRRLLDVLQGRGAALLAGDFNAAPDSPVLKLFAGEWQNATAGQTRLTIPAESPRRQIDFVLARPANGWRVVETAVIDEKVASDHRPLLVVLERIAEAKR